MSECDLIMAGFTVLENELARIQKEMDQFPSGGASWNTLAQQKSILQNKLCNMIDDLIGLV